MTANRRRTVADRCGGAGKTRLAIEVASRLVDAFPDGVWLVELAALSDPRLVPQVAAKVLEVKEQPPRPVTETLGDYLASKKLLLVLDNAEHPARGLRAVRGPHCPSQPGGRYSRDEPRAPRHGGRADLPSPVAHGARSGRQLASDALLAYEGVRLFVDRARLLASRFQRHARECRVACFHLPRTRWHTFWPSSLRHPACARCRRRS